MENLHIQLFDLDMEQEHIQVEELRRLLAYCSVSELCDRAEQRTLENLLERC